MSEQPEQVSDEAPETPDPADAGEGEENSRQPVQDDERPEDLNTSGF